MYLHHNFLDKTFGASQAETDRHTTTSHWSKISEQNLKSNYLGFWRVNNSGQNGDRCQTWWSLTGEITIFSCPGFT